MKKNLLLLFICSFTSVTFSQTYIEVDNYVNLRYIVRPVYSDGSTLMYLADYIVLESQQGQVGPAIVHPNDPNFSLVYFKVFCSTFCTPWADAEFIYNVTDLFEITTCQYCNNNFGWVAYDSSWDNLTIRCDN